MKKLFGVDIDGSYVFDPAAKTITLLGYNYDLNNFLLITNVTRNTSRKPARAPSSSAWIHPTKVGAHYATRARISPWLVSSIYCIRSRGW